MGKKLVAYFSASGSTKVIAERLAKASGSDLFEIEPKVPYTSADLDWMDKESRSSIEMKDPSSRPEMGSRLTEVENYETIYLGFPIWWYTSPTIINTFLESYDFSGKTIILFATSGGSGLGKCVNSLAPSCSSSTKIIEGKMFNNNPSEKELSKWAKSMEG